MSYTASYRTLYCPWLWPWSLNSLNRGASLLLSSWRFWIGHSYFSLRPHRWSPICPLNSHLRQRWQPPRAGRCCRWGGTQTWSPTRQRWRTAGQWCCRAGRSGNPSPVQWFDIWKNKVLWMVALPGKRDTWSWFPDEGWVQKPVKEGSAWPCCDNKGIIKESALNSVLRWLKLSKIFNKRKRNKAIKIQAL